MAVIGKIRSYSGLLVGIIILGLILFLLGDALNNQFGLLKGRNDAVVGSVNGNSIDVTEFNRLVDENVAKFQLNRGKDYVISEDERNYLRNQTWSEYIEKTLMEPIYTKEGIMVSPDELYDIIQGKHPDPQVMQAFTDPQTGQFNRDQVRQVWENMDVDREGDEPGTQKKRILNFENAIEKGQLKNKYESLFAKAYYIPTWMAKMKHDEQNASVSFDYAALPYTSIPDAEVKLTDEELNKYFEENKKRFMKESSRYLKIVGFPIIPSKSDSAENLLKLQDLFAKFKTAPNDSMFINAYSERPFDNIYLTMSQLPPAYADTIMNSPLGTFMGPLQIDSSYAYLKVLDKKAVPDSVKSRHILFSFDKIKTQEEANAKFKLIDSVMLMADTLNMDFGMLAAQYSDDQASRIQGGDLGWAQPDMMVKPFNDAIFFHNTGRIMKVVSQFGIHLVQVTGVATTKPGVEIAVLSRKINYSTETEDKSYADASDFASKNNTADAFTKATAGMDPSLVIPASVSVEDINVRGVGPAREMVKWAFENKRDAISPVFRVANSNFVAIIEQANDKNDLKMEDVRPQVEYMVRFEKKVEMLSKKINEAGGNFDQTIAKLQMTVANANGVNFSAPMLSTAGYEPQVVATAIALGPNKTSKAIRGNAGVYLVRTTAFTPAPATQNYTDITKNITDQFRSSIQFSLFDGLKKSAEIVDDRIKWF